MVTTGPQFSAHLVREIQYTVGSAEKQQKWKDYRICRKDPHSSGKIITEAPQLLSQQLKTTQIISEVSFSSKVLAIHAVSIPGMNKFRSICYVAGPGSILP